LYISRTYIGKRSKVKTYHMINAILKLQGGPHIVLTIVATHIHVVNRKSFVMGYY